MKPFRYRKPSVKTALGVTKAKKTVKRQTGITAVTKPTRAASNLKRTVKRKAGYYSAPAKLVRAGKAPTPLGCMLPMVLIVFLAALALF